MVALIGSATALPTLLEDFIRVQLEAIAACRTAIPLLSGPDERAMVVGLKHDYERHVEELRRLAAAHRTAIPEHGTPHEARTIGRIRLAHRRGGDGDVLEALAVALREASEAYDRALRNAALGEATRPLFQRAAADVRRHRVRLGEAARFAA